MDCNTIPLVEYEEFKHYMQTKIYQKRVPCGGSFEITDQCNLRCAHCYVVPDEKAPQLSTSEIKRILDELAEEGCLWLTLTGGEPLTRSDFLDIYTYASKKGFFITLFTNGTLITSEIADILADWRPFVIEITLLGATKKTYEEITGQPGSYEQSLRGIELLCRRKLRLRLKTMVMTLNKHELEDMKEIAEEFGVDFRYDPVLNPRLDGSRDPYEFRLSVDEVIAVEMADKERAKHWDMFWRNFRNSKSSDKLFSCGAGQNKFHIDARGKLSMCVMARIPEYDLRKGSFREGWWGPVLEAKSRQRSLSSECRRCGKIAVCGQCPGWSRLEHGDDETPVEYLCELTRRRAKVFDSGFAT